MFTKRIVLAVRQDDERNVISELLEEQGMLVMHAHSAREIIHAIEDYQCDLIVTDIQLPDMHAWMMLRKIAEIKPATPVHVIALADELVAAPVKDVKLVVRPVALATLKLIIREWRETSSQHSGSQ